MKYQRVERVEDKIDAGVFANGHTAENL